MAMVKIKTLLSATALTWGIMASGVQSAEINTNIARMQAMDKITGMVRVVDVPVNSEVKYGSFSIVVRACKTRPPEETPENFAFVDVVDNYNTENPVNIFRGWMISSSPSLNPVEHPIYDIWLLSCDNGKIDPKLKIMSEDELKAREQIPQREKEIEANEAQSEPKMEEIAPNEVSDKLTVETVDTKVEEDISAKVETPDSVQTPSSAQLIENTEEGPQALINITAPVPEPSEDKVNVEAETKDVVSEDEKSNVDAMVVITAPDEENIETVSDDKNVLILQQEPAQLKIDEVVADETINTEEIEENGMLDEQLIDFSE